MSALRQVVGGGKQLVKFGLRRLVERHNAAVQPLSPAYWGLQRAASGALTLDGVDLNVYVKACGVPLHIVNARRLRENIARFEAVPQNSTSGCEVYYSYKTNPIPGVLSALHERGIGAEVTSPYELWLAKRLGVPSSKIIVNGSAKSPAMVRDAIVDEVQLLNINHREEIAMVAAIARELGRKPRIGVRVVTSESWGGQFGVPIAGGQARRAYEEALASPHLDVVALHAHRGGMIRSEEALTTFVRAVLEFAGELQQQLGLSLQILDFGGSLGTPGVRPLSRQELKLNRALGRLLSPPDTEGALSIDRYVSTLVDLVGVHYRGRPGPHIFVEPGRAMTSDTQMLVGRVQSIKSSGDRTYALVDTGINVAESCRSEYHQVFSTGRADGESRVYTLAGPICTPADTLIASIRLPVLEPGDTLAIMDAGAYFVPFSTSFSFPRPAIVMVDRGEATLIRRAETFEDLVGYDLGPTSTRAVR